MIFGIVLVSGVQQGDSVIHIRIVVVQSLSPVQLSVTPWIVTCKTPLSSGFPRQEYWSEWHFLLQGIFPTQALNLHWQADALLQSHQGCPRMPYT